MLRIFIIAVFLFTAFSSEQGFAVETERKALGSLNNKLNRYTDDKKSLQKNAKKAGKAFKKTQKKLVNMSAKVQQNESALFELENRLGVLKIEQDQIQKDLRRERASMAQIISALEKVRRTPPQALIARPGAPIDTARGAMLLERVLPILYSKAQSLKDKSESYRANEEELITKQEELIILRKQLDGQEKELKTLLVQREQQYAKASTNLKQHENEIKRVSKEAKNLAELIQNLEAERTRRAREMAAAQRGNGIEQAALPPLGKSQLPLRGTIRTRYNETDGFGAKSKGVSIEARAGSLIVAPMNGTVRFAGFFKNYGNMVVIEHSDGYHSLIAGLEKIDTVLNQNVSAGEPLGRLYNPDDGKMPTLYFELRQKGKAINPARQFRDLG